MDQQTRELLSCELLNLDSRIVDKKTVINGILIELALFQLGNASLKEAIIDEINKFVGMSKYFSVSDFDTAIQECLLRKTVNIDKFINKYYLSEIRKIEFENSYHNVESLKENISKNLTSYIELELANPLDSQQISSISTLFFEILTKQIYESSLLIVREKTTIEEVINKFNESEPTERIEEILNEIPYSSNKVIKSKVIYAIKKYINDFPEELEKFLKLILFNIFINQILNLDPSLVKINLRWLKERQLYLDTNVLLSLFCETHNMHQIVKGVIDACKLLHIQLYISPITKEEIEKYIVNTKDIYKKITGNTILEIAARNCNNPILAEYFEIKFSNPALDWVAFISEFDVIDDLLLDHNILVEDKCFIEAKSASNYEDIRKIIKDKKPLWISESVLNHDVINCLIIYYRKKDSRSDERGQKIWLLTIDRTLMRSQKVLLSSKQISNPYCMQISEWGEIVLPWINIIDLDYKNFLGYLAKAKFGILPEGDYVQLDCFETINNAQLNLDILLELPPHHTQKAMIAIQESEEIKKIIDSAGDPEKKIDKRELDNRLTGELQKIIIRTDPKEERINNLEKEKELLVKKLENANSLIQEITNSPLFKLMKKIMSFFRIKNIS